MASKSIADFIKGLEVEIRKNTDLLKKESELLRLQEIAKTYAGDDKLISSLEIAENIKNAPDIKKVMSGFKGLDDILKGFTLGQLVVVSALTKSGKTTFCVELTGKMKEENPLWLPFEESAQELVQKFLDRGEVPPLFYTPSIITENTLSWIEKRIIEAKAKFNTSIVFIDQLDFIVPMNGDNHALRVGEAMRELKRMARQWNVVIFIICHLVKTKMDVQPTVEDLKGSSSIGQEADTVIILWREMRRIGGSVIITSNINVSVQANRRTGSTGNVPMVFVNGRFLEQDWQHEDDSKW